MNMVEVAQKRYEHLIAIRKETSLRVRNHSYNCSLDCNNKLLRFIETSKTNPDDRLVYYAKDKTEYNRIKFWFISNGYSLKESIKMAKEM